MVERRIFEDYNVTGKGAVVAVLDDGGVEHGAARNLWTPRRLVVVVDEVAGKSLQKILLRERFGNRAKYKRWYRFDSSDEKWKAM